MMQQRNKPRPNQSRSGGSRTMLYVIVAIVAIGVAYYFVTPILYPKPPVGPSISLNPSADIPGAMVTILGKNLTASHAVTATFASRPLNLTGTCATDAQGNLAGCTFVIPSNSSGQYTVQASDGTHSLSAVFTIPGFLPPYSTLLVSLTSLGLGFVTQIVTRQIVDLNAERRMKAEVNAFNKEKRDATAANDKAKLEKLKKRELQVRQSQTKISSARLKVTAITFIPLLGVYYLMSSFLGGFGVIVGYIPIPIPYIAGAPALAGGWQVSLFWWYFLSSFTFSSLLTRLLHTST